jgi:hypothetical protein
MDRASLTPIAQSDLDRPDTRWWHYLIPPVGRVPQWSWFVLTSIVRETTLLVRCIWRRIWPALATPWHDVPAGPMPFAKVAKRAGVQMMWVVPGLMLVSGVATYHAAQPSIPPTTREVARPIGLYAERLQFQASDGRQVHGLWVPALAATDVNDDGIDAIKRRRPAVVLVHDNGHDERQMIPLVRQLHAKELNVLVVRLRSADADQPAATTFGVTESLDVAGAIDHVRNRPTVDPDKVAAWGVGTGATAVRNADVGSAIALAVLQREAASGGVDDRVLPVGERFDLLRPICRWMLAVAYNAAPRGKTVPARRIESIDRTADGYDLVSGHFSNTIRITKVR